MALHSQGEEIYYQYGPRTPKQSALVAQMLASVGGYRAVSYTHLGQGKAEQGGRRKG